MATYGLTQQQRKNYFTKSTTRVPENVIDYVELFVFTLDDVLVDRKKFTFSEIFSDNYVEYSGVLKLNIGQHLRDLGYSVDDFRVEYKFFKRVAGNSQQRFLYELSNGNEYNQDQPFGTKEVNGELKYFAVNSDDELDLERELVFSRKAYSIFDISPDRTELVIQSDPTLPEIQSSFLNKCPDISWIKVGLELFTAEGPSIIKTFKDMNKKIFLDLKFHDIPNTMSAASYQVSKLGVDMISLHASAGLNALQLSKEATLKASKEINNKPPEVIAVTVLTSLSSQNFKYELNRNSTIQENVISLSSLSYKAGLDGCVCSPLEVQSIRDIYADKLTLVTPGIRFDRNNINDQSRFMSPEDAISSGASKIVVGRAITKNINPSKIFSEICESIS